MFKFIIRYFGFLKFVPGLALVFDGLLNLFTLLFNPCLLDYFDELEKEVLSWHNTTTTTHKYGGLQFNYGSKELGHIHSNGLLDMLLSRKVKRRLMEADSRVQDHHSFKNSGWISFYITNNDDKEFALKLLAVAYSRYADKELISLNFIDEPAVVRAHNY